MALVYSCCFWFSLRLGGILIGFFSIFQAALGLIFMCIAFQQPQNIKDQISLWIKNTNLIYVNGYLESFQTDPEKYITYSIVIISIYTFICVVYIYGAYACNNSAMAGFILVELIRLITLSILVTTWLLVLKENTMDIGLVIGVSVASGFALLGLFYLWVCAANLPILVNEIEREEQRAIIEKLQRLLENRDQRLKPTLINTFENDNEDLYRRQLFVIPRYNFPRVGQASRLKNDNY